MNKDIIRIVILSILLIALLVFSKIGYEDVTYEDTVIVGELHHTRLKYYAGGPYTTPSYFEVIYNGDIYYLNDKYGLKYLEEGEEVSCSVVLRKYFFGYNIIQSIKLIGVGPDDRNCGLVL